MLHVCILLRCTNLVLFFCQSACDEQSPARGHDRAALDRRREIDGLDPLPEPATPAFVQDVRPQMDWCENPHVQKLHGTMSFDFPRETIMRPIFVLSKHQRNNEFLFPPMEAYENATSKEALSKYLPWESKTVNKLLWRGTSTGDSYSKRKSDPNYDWRKQHRPRLHLMAQRREGEQAVWLKRGKEWVPENWGVARLNQQYLDVGLTGKPHQVGVCLVCVCCVSHAELSTFPVQPSRRDMRRNGR